MESKTPLYATEGQIADRVFGPGRLAEWRAFAAVQERHGLPQIDPVTGRRFLPAVLAFLYRRHGLGTQQPATPDGAETWPTKSLRQDFSGENAPAGNVVPIGSGDRTS
jgi:hypothetical protein